MAFRFLPDTSRARSPSSSFTAIVVVSALICSCATTVPYTGQGPHPQLERGVPFPPVDFIGNVLSLPGKLLLWNWQFNLHTISTETEEKLVAYLDDRTLPAFEDTHYRLNQYRPAQDLSRLIKNKHVAWPYRLLLGLPTTLISDVLLPGRLFPWGDYYNPFTNTVHLYSDHEAIALHEAGHAYDFADKKYKGTYAAVRLVPFVDLYQEWQASREAIYYFREVEDHPAEVRAYKALYPAYGTYVGSYFFAPVGSILGALVGHAAGRSKATLRQNYYDKLEAARQRRPLPQTKPVSAPPANQEVTR